MRQLTSEVYQGVIARDEVPRQSRKRDCFASFAMTLFIFFCFSVASIYAQNTALNLSELVQEAKANNPDILAAKKRWEASLARVPQAKSLEDPQIGFAFEKIPRGTLKFNKAMPDDRLLSFAQFLPFFGKLSLKGKIAVVDAQIAASEYKSKELEIINQVKSAYYDLFMNYKEIELKQESLSLLEGVAKVAEAKYSVGDIRQEEVYKIHSELAGVNNDIINLTEEKAARQTRLNTLLGREPEGVLGRPSLNEDIVAQKEIRSLYQSTLLNQPELIMFSYAVERNKFAKSLSKRSFFPDLMANITQRGFASGTFGPWDLMLSFSMPFWFWTKQRYEVKEAIANLEEAQAAYQAMKNKAFSEVKDLNAKIEIAKNKIKLYKSDLMPIAEGSLEVSLTSFSSGGGDFMMLLDNQRMLVEIKINYYKALVEYNISLADLERVVGLTIVVNPKVKK